MNRISINDAPVETVSTQKIVSYIDGKIDDDRIYTFHFDFDNDRLLSIFHDLASDPINVRSYPWYDPSPEQSRINVGWSELDVLAYKEGRPSTINDYPYIRELIKEFDSKIIAIRWFKNKPYFAYGVHFDQASKKERLRLTVNQVMYNYDLTEQEARAYIKWRSNGTKTAIAHLLTQGDEPIEFTYENQKDYDSRDWHKSTKDYRYHYKTALLNTHWTHYVTGDCKNERLMFRISIFDKNFWDTKKMLKDRGL